MSEEKKLQDLERELAELKAYLFYLKPAGISPARKLQQIRSECRNRYFGSWSDMRDGRISYGPNGKNYSDYSVIEDIIRKMSGMLFKYSKGKANGSCVITGMVETKEDFQLYESLCDSVCHYMKEQIERYTKEEA